MELTISCGCGRKMSPNTLLGAGNYRCGCGMRIRIEGLPIRSSTRCPNVVCGRVCNEPKASEAEVCRDCAKRIVVQALDDPRVWRDAVLSSAQTKYREGQREAIERWTEEREKESARERDKRSMIDLNIVYYVRVKPGVVKIGTTRHLPSRLTALRLDEDDVLATEPGTQKLEAVRHKQFAHLQTGRYRENFQLADELQAHIDAVVAKHGAPIRRLPHQTRRGQQKLAREGT